MSTVKAIQLREPKNWNLLLEFDVIWQIPKDNNNNDKKQNKSTKPNRRVYAAQQHSRRHKRQLYSNFESALDRWIGSSLVARRGNYIYTYTYSIFRISLAHSKINISIYPFVAPLRFVLGRAYIQYYSLLFFISFFFLYMQSGRSRQELHSTSIVRGQVAVKRTRDLVNWGLAAGDVQVNYILCRYVYTLYSHCCLFSILQWNYYFIYAYTRALCVHHV